MADKTFEVIGTYKVGNKVEEFSNLYVASSASAAEKFAKKEFESRSGYYNVPRGTKLTVNSSKHISEAEIQKKLKN
jgi:hypothetical protein